MSIDEIRRRATKFHAKILWRNAREYLAALAVVIFCAYESWITADALTRAGFLLTIAGMAYLAWQLHRRGASRSLPEEMGLASGVEFFRRELERQRDLVRTVWRWYLGPLIPGWVVLMAGLARRNPGHVRYFALTFILFNLFAAGCFLFVWKLNQRAAGRLQQRIDELDALQRG